MVKSNDKTVDAVNLENKQSELSHKVWDLQKKKSLVRIGSDGSIKTKDLFRIKNQMKENEIYVSDYKKSSDEQRGLIKIGDELYRVDFLKNSAEETIIDGFPASYYLNRANHTGTNDADKLNGQLPSYYLDRANHTGSESIGMLRVSGNTNPPAASTNYYLGHLYGTSDIVSRMYMPVACTITAIMCSWVYFGTPSSQTMTIYLMKNGSTNTLITNSLGLTWGGGVVYTINTTGLSVSLAAGDFINYRLATPAWTTAPTQLYFTANAYFKT